VEEVAGVAASGLDLFFGPAAGIDVDLQ